MEVRRLISRGMRLRRDLKLLSCFNRERNCSKTQHRDITISYRRDLQATSPKKNAYKEQLELAFKLFKLGVENERLDRDTRSHLAHNERVPELEDDDDTVTAVGREMPDTSRFQLRPHQREALGRWLHHTQLTKCFLFADDMGLGKTAVAVARIIYEISRRQKSRASSPQFLIVVPTNLLQTWVKELARCPSIRVLTYHTGHERRLSKVELLEFHVILTTYAIVASEVGRLRLDRDATRQQSDQFTPQLAGDGALLLIRFDEVILDEAHTIRNRHSSRAKALQYIDATSRVCITGTPIQNGVWDVFSLLRFMRLRPWDDEEFYKACFARRVRKSEGKRLQQSVETILFYTLHSIQLRRTKHQMYEGKPLYNIQGVDTWFWILEADLDLQQSQEATRHLWSGRAAARETVDDTNVPTLLKIHRARTYCNHPLLPDARYNDTWVESSPSNDVRSSLYQHNRSEFKRKISKGRGIWRSIKLRPIVDWIRRQLLNLEKECLLMKSQAERKEHRARNKVLIFSETISALDLLEIGIKEEIGPNLTVHFNGTCSRREKQEILNRFEEVDKDFTNESVNPDPAMIMLATMKTVSEGLTLVHARHVFFIAPHWNPYFHEQALSRAARMGQRGRVQVHYFRVKYSIDRRVWSTACAKRALVRGLEEDSSPFDVRQKQEEELFEWFQDSLVPGDR